MVIKSLEVTDMSQELTAEQQELLSSICVVVANNASIHANKPTDSINFEDSVETLFDGNVYRFGHMLLDIHEIYELELAYEPLTEFQTFTTVSDVIRYFFEQLLAKKD